MFRECILLGSVELHKVPALRGKLHRTQAEEIRISEQWKESAYEAIEVCR